MKKDGKKIVGYGAAAKGDVLLNYCGIGPDIIDYIVDKNKLKQNKYLPGKRIPVYDVSHLKRDVPDCLLILPWNLSDEIIEQEKWLREKGCKFLISIPHVKYI
jgi:hypothetical protein